MDTRAHTIPQKPRKIGIVNGATMSQALSSKCYEYLKPVRQLLSYHKPIMRELHNYVEIINDMGLLACGNPRLLRAIGNHHEYMYTVVVGGGNMSFKSRSLIDRFALPGYTKRGIHYERLLVLHYVRLGFHSVVFNGGFVEHLERESLSRPKNRISKFMVRIEYNLLLYGVHLGGPSPQKRM